MDRHVELIASSAAFETLCDDCKQNRRKHAYEFESGDFDALDTLAALFICMAEEGRVRPETLQRIRSGGYTDIVRLPRAEKKGKMDVEEASYLIDTAYFTPTELSAKYYIVAASEPLSPAVQNKLLKTLEEPPESSRFLLFSRGNDLLPTVSSRCGLVPLLPFSVETIEKALTDDGADEYTAFLAAAISHGQIGTARRVAADSKYRTAFDNAMHFLLHVKRSPQILPYASTFLASKDMFGTVIDCFELIWRDCMAYAARGGEAVLLRPALSDIRTLAREYTIDVCLALMPLLTKARDRIRLYGNAASYIDELLFSILEVKAKCLK